MQQYNETIVSSKRWIQPMQKKKSFGTEKTTRRNYRWKIIYCDKEGLFMMNFGINIFFGISYSTIVMCTRTIWYYTKHFIIGFLIFLPERCSLIKSKLAQKNCENGPDTHTTRKQFSFLNKFHRSTLDGWMNQFVWKLWKISYASWCGYNRSN